MARRLGVDEKAIRKGIASGRFRDSLSEDERGRKVIANPDLAEEEWRRNSSRVPFQTADSGARTPLSAPSAPAPDQDAILAGSLVEAQRHATNERARKLRFENDLREGRLIEVEKAQKEAFGAARIIREAVLNIPSRLSAELAAESDPGRVFRKLDAALREALTGAADALLAAANE